MQDMPRSDRRRRMLVAVLALLLALLAIPAAAEASLRYAAPSAQGAANCSSPANACTVEAALAGSTPSDTVVLAGNEGTYGTQAAPLTSTFGTPKSDSPGAIEGAAGQPRPVFYSNASPVFDLFNQTTNGKGEVVATSISNVDIEELNSSLPFTLDAGGAVDHVIVRNHGGGTALAPLGVTTGSQLITNSLFVSRGFSSSGVGISASGSPQVKSVTLRNDTLYATGTNARALEVSITGSGFTINLLATNVIANGEEDDILTNQSSGAQVNVTLDHSSYAHVSQAAGTTLTAPGTASNQTAPPLFVDAAGEDFHQQAGSPTLDAGIASPANGLTDLDGNPRAIGPSSDIGAYEATEGTPVIAPGAVTAITTSGATLNAGVNPDFANTTVRALIGTSTSTETALAPQILGAGLTSIPVAFAAGSLTPGVLYHLHFTAENRLGATSSPDQTFTTPAPAVASPGRLALLSATAALHGSAVGVKLSCSAASSGCRGKLVLSLRVKVKVRTRGRHPHTRTITVNRTLGHVTFALAAGRSATLPVTLTREARSRLARAPHSRLTVAATATRSDGGAGAGRSIVLVAPASRKRAKHA